MFKKLFLIVSLAFTGLAVAAEVPVLVINHAPKGSPITTFAKTYQEGVPNSEFYQASNCEDAKKKFLDTPNAIFVYDADVGVAARLKNMNCEPDHLTKETLIASTRTYLNFCTSGTKPVAWDGQTKTSLFGKKTIGMASVILAPNTIRDFTISGIDVKGIPYSGSSTTAAAVIAGDVDFGLIIVGASKPGMSSGQLKCTHTTDPASPNYLGKAFPKMTFPNNNVWMDIYTRSADPALKEKALAGAKSEVFQSFLKSQSYVDTKIGQHTDEDIKAWNAWLNKLQEQWN